MYVPSPSHERHSFEQRKVLMPWTFSSTFVEDSVTVAVDASHNHVSMRFLQTASIHLQLPRTILEFDNWLETETTLNACKQQAKGQRMNSA
eukprot:4004471-Karenia_brevis.AAC.1